MFIDYFLIAAEGFLDPRLKTFLDASQIGKWSGCKSLFFDQMRKGVCAKIQKIGNFFTLCYVKT